MDTKHIPHEHVDKDSKGEKNSSVAGLSAEEEDEVADKTECDHPYHV